MCALSNLIREEPDWWERVKDEAIVERWREEALKQTGDGELEQTWKLDSGMVRYQLSSCNHCYSPMDNISRSSMCLRNFRGTQICAMKGLE